MLKYKLISYIFHPVIFSIIATLLYFIILPSHITKQSEHTILLIVFLSTYIVPILLILFLKRFNMVRSFQLATIAERKFPILFMIFLFIFLGRILLLTEVVNLLAYSFFACALALLFVYVLFFNNIKVSLHTLSISGLIGFLCIISYNFQLNLLVPIIALFLIFGIIATARLKLEAHNSNEVYLGFFIGFLSQLFSYYILTSYNI